MIRQIGQAVLLLLTLLTSQYASASHELTLDDLVIQSMRTYKISGVSLALIDGDRVSYNKTYSGSQGITVSNNSLFQGADIAQSMLMIAVMQLAEQDRIDLDNDISQYGNVDNKNTSQHMQSMTVRDLLLLNRKPSTTNVLNEMLFRRIPKLVTIMNDPNAELETLPIDKPDQRELWQDRNNIAVVLQNLIQDITHKPLNDYLHSAVFSPLSMDHTQVILQKPIYRDDVQSEIASNTDMSEISDGGVWTTANDLGQFVIAMMKSYRGRSGYLLSTAASKWLLEQPGKAYTFDTGMCGNAFHFHKLAENAGYNNLIVGFPQTGQGLVIMTNTTHSEAFLNELVQAIGKEREWPTIPQITENDVIKDPAPCRWNYFHNKKMQQALWPPLFKHDPMEGLVTDNAGLPQSTMIAALKGGINAGNLTACHQHVLQRCEASSSLSFYHCAQQQMQTQSRCGQSLAMLQATGGIAVAIDRSPQIDVVKVLVDAKDHDSEYFIVTHNGEFIPLTTAMKLDESTETAYLHKQYPQLMLWPIAENFPSHQLLDDESQRLIFQQKLTDGCYDCKAAGRALVAYDFNKRGRFLRTTILGVT